MRDEGQWWLHLHHVSMIWNIQTNSLVTISLYHPNSFIILGLEGKAGMATIVDEHKNLDLLSLTKALQKSLPPYARPVFIRLASEVDTTGNCSLIIQITVELNRCIHKAGD